MKKFACLLLCAVLLLTAACGREEPPTEPTEAPTRPVVEVPMETEAVQLKYEGIQLAFWSLLGETDPETQVVKQASAFFEATTGAKVIINWMAGDETRIAEALSGDLQADIFDVPGESLKQNYLQYALDLTELAGVAEYESKSWEALRMQMLSRYGSMKAVAYRPYLYGMYYNQSSFDALEIETAPSTWEEYLNFCRMLKENGYEALVIDQERAHLILELHMERALGWDTLRDTMVNGQWRKNEMAMTMIQNAIQFAEDGYLVKGTPATYPAGQNRLGQSNALLVAGSNLLCSEVERSCLTDVKWGVFPYPGDGPGSGLLVDADVLAVNASSTTPEAAFDFVMLLTTGEFDQLRADVTTGIPADPANSSPITGAAFCMASATPQAPKWFTSEHNLLFSRLWNGWYKTGAYFANQLNGLARQFASEKTVG